MSDGQRPPPSSYTTLALLFRLRLNLSMSTSPVLFLAVEISSLPSAGAAISEREPICAHHRRPLHVTARVSVFESPLSSQPYINFETCPGSSALFFLSTTTATARTRQPFQPPALTMVKTVTGACPYPPRFDASH